VDVRITNTDRITFEGQPAGDASVLVR
jgi:hypothetical protein